MRILCPQHNIHNNKTVKMDDVNGKKMSPKDVTNIGDKMSNECHKIMYEIKIYKEIMI